MAYNTVLEWKEREAKRTYDENNLGEFQKKAKLCQTCGFVSTIHKLHQRCPRCQIDRLGKLTYKLTGTWVLRSES